VRDLSSGYRLYQRRAIAGLTLHARDAHALAEILIRVHGEGWTIREIHVEDLARRTGRPHRRLDSPVALLRLWRLRNSVLAADYDARAFDSAIWFQRHWQRTRHRIVMDMLDGRDAILDVGCGSGRIILDLPDAVGLDILHRKLRWLRPRHRLLVCGSADRLPFADASFSTVVCSEVIEHIPDRPEVLGEMTRVLRPGGVLILGTPDYGRRLWRALEWAYGKVLPDAYADEHITHFTRQSLAQRLRRAGYEILDCRYLMSSVVIFKARKPAPVTVHTNGVAHPHEATTPPRVAAPGH
jgi:ubiquinone/menaquinone biosynthesis C-methylase UbiE